MEEKTEINHKPCEADGTDDFNCIDCPAFEECQMILYDSYDEAGDDEDKDESGLSIV